MNQDEDLAICWSKNISYLKALLRELLGQEIRDLVEML